MADSQRLRIICPCCQATLTIDSKTGLVLHKEERKSAYSFEEALAREKTRKGKSDEFFEKAFLEEKRRHAALEEKFQQALESKDELDEPPPRPWDLD